MPAYFGDYDTTETVIIPFNTFSSDDPSASVTVTDLASGDVEIHKDGSTTQRASDNGVTVTINFDSVTGNHIVSIDLSDNSDAGYYSAGSRYQVRLEGITVDGATLNVWIGTFSIGCTLRPTTDGRTLDVETGGCAGIDWANVANPTTAVDLSATDIQLCDTVTTLTGHTAQTGDNFAIVNGDHGLVSIQDDIDAILVDTGTTLQAELDGIQADTEDIQTQIGTAGDGLTAVPWNANWDAEVESEVTDSLVAHNLDHLCLTATAGADMTTEVADNTILSRILANGDTSAFDPTTDGLQLIRDHIGDGTNLTEAGGDGDHLTESGGTGDQFTAIPWNANWDAEVESEVTDSLVAHNLDHLCLTATAGADMTTEVADNTILSRILANGDTSAFDPTTDGLQLIRDRGDAAWTTGSGGDATAAKQDSIIAAVITNAAGTDIAADIIAVKAETATIVADTNELQTDLTNGGRLDSLIDGIKSVTDDMQMISDTIASVDTADTVFVLTTGLTANDDPNNAVISIYDSTGNVWSGPRRITDYVHAGKQITIDADTAFPLAAGDTVRIWNTSYATTAAAGAVSASDIADIADAVWDESSAAHRTAASTGKKLHEASLKWM